ncbi:MAG: EamA family transporter, partial [Armatimonadota bacterium]
MSPAGPPSRAVAAGYTAAVIHGVATGVYYAVQKDLLRDTQVIPLNWLQMFVMGAWAGGIILWRRAWSPTRGEPADLVPPVYPFLLLFSLIASVLFFGRNAGVQLTTATTGVVIVRLEIAFTLLLSYLVLRQRVRLPAWLGIGGMVLGAFLVSRVSAAGFGWEPSGILLLVLAAVGIAVNALIIKTKFSQVPNELVIVYSATVQFVLYGLATFITGQQEAVRELLASPSRAFEAAAGGLLIGITLFSYYYSMKRIPMWAARVL